MLSVIAHDYLQKLLHKRDEVHIAVIHVKLTHPLESKVLVNFIENTARDLNLLWAISKPGIAVSDFHVLMSFYHTLKAFALGTNISSKFSIEFLLRLTCEDQISRALKIAGLNERTENFCLYLMSSDAEAIKTLLSMLALQFKGALIESTPYCHGETLLSELKVSIKEFTSNSYSLSVLDPKVKSVLTRLSLLNIRR
ncbi:MAG: KEOPS complex subunit Cgi121 [Candidatus Nezhaarchaeota archaeon]|nr:KEOPS complex subunit Cgi121 [Candidatus Nezhaarchaeota archaeon]MCX8141905.1 KEOPS complex subunit Cgi121 [Candidatus Nezhaarchaeota archaeon]MDW8050314.1 KEOPS complex subunit Cgi121 [Nitrososphaerota archaeon]